jgi:hypothetical protein
MVARKKGGVNPSLNKEQNSLALLHFLKDIKSVMHFPIYQRGEEIALLVE